MKLAPTPPSGFGFGRSVDVDGDTAVVGHRGDRAVGAAYVYVREGNTWLEQAKLVAPDGFYDDFFGASVAVSDDTVVVGATGTQSGRGAAYVFVRSGTSWQLQATLTAFQRRKISRFGLAVDIDKATVVVSGYSSSGTNLGSAFVFVRSADVWSGQQELTATNYDEAILFGSAVSVDQDTTVIGAFGVGGYPYRGAAYVFVRVDTSWSEQAELSAADGSLGDEFSGSGSVDLQGDRVVIGAPQDDTTAGIDSGSAYVFVRSGDAWAQEAQLTGNDATADDGFGSSVSISGSVLTIGAPRAEGGGSAYVFAQTDGEWSQVGGSVHDPASTDLSFGASVAISGHVAIVGDPDGGRWSGGTATVWSVTRQG